VAIKGLENSPEAIKAGVRVLIRAFASDPLWVYVFPESGQRQKKLGSVFEFLVRFGLKRGWVETLAQSRGLAVWLPDQYARPGIWDSISGRGWSIPFQTGLGPLRRMLRVERFIFQLQRQLIFRPHQYLALVGVELECQNMGLGTRLVRQGIERCQRLGCRFTLRRPTGKISVFISASVSGW
jgi:GNAT superfamily N-acetyltransferase